MRIIAAPRDENDILEEERSRIAVWAPTHGWRYVEYADALDLLSQLNDGQPATPDPVTEIEIVAHGRSFRLAAFRSGIALQER